MEGDNNICSGGNRRPEEAVSNMFSFVFAPVCEKETHNSKCCGKNALRSLYGSFLCQISLCTPLALSDLAFSVLSNNYYYGGI